MRFEQKKLVIMLRVLGIFTFITFVTLGSYLNTVELLFLFLVVFLIGIVFYLNSLRENFSERIFFSERIENCLLSLIHENRMAFLPIVLTLLELSSSILLAVVILFFLLEPSAKFLIILFVIYAIIITIFIYLIMLVSISKSKFQKAELSGMFKEKFSLNFIVDQPVTALRDAFPMLETYIREKAGIEKETYGVQLIDNTFSAGNPSSKNQAKKSSNSEGEKLIYCEKITTLRKTFPEFETYVREKSRTEINSESLVVKVFIKKGVLSEKQTENITDVKHAKLFYSKVTNEQNGLRDILRGISAFYRNPLMHHEEREHINERSALILLRFLDELTQVIDRCKLQDTEKITNTNSQDKSTSSDIQ